VDEMQSVINDKTALDSQFSDAMAIRVFSRIIDPLASKKANIKRIEDFIKVQKAEDKNKQALFNSIKVGGELNQPQRQRENEQKEVTIPQPLAEQIVTILKQPQFKAMPVENVMEMIRANPQLQGISDDQINALIKQAGSR